MDNIENEVQDAVEILATGMFHGMITVRAAQAILSPGAFARVSDELEDLRKRQRPSSLVWKDGKAMDAEGWEKHQVPQESPRKEYSDPPLLKLGPGGDFVREISGEEILTQVDTEEINAQAQGADVEPAAWSN